MPPPDLFRCRFRCTRLLRVGEFGLPTHMRLCFMEGKVAVIPFDMANQFQYEGLLESIEVVQPNETLDQSEIEWSYS